LLAIPAVPSRKQTKSPMILSHKHKFIYVKTIKTASSSIEIALSRFLGDEDIITPARSDLQQQRPENRQAQNYRLDHPAIPKRPFFKRLLGRPERHYHPSIGYYEHMPAWRIKAYIGDEIWDEYYKFSFERNPWDRQVSFFNYKNRNKSTPISFENSLKQKKTFVNNYDLYSIGGDIALDFVGKYENLAEDFQKIAARIGLEGEVTLPVANAVKKSTSKPYREYYDEKSRQLIGEWYRREIEFFDYKF